MTRRPRRRKIGSGADALRALPTRAEDSDPRRRRILKDPRAVKRRARRSVDAAARVTASRAFQVTFRRLSVPLPFPPPPAALRALYGPRSGSPTSRASASPSSIVHIASPTSVNFLRRFFFFFFSPMSAYSSELRGRGKRQEERVTRFRRSCAMNVNR